MEHTGPKHTNEITEVSLKDMNFVQEQLAPIGIEYALLSYVPVNPRNVIVAVNGLMLLQGDGYVIDGRKIQFTPVLQAQNDRIYVSYATANPVADIPAVDIEFDIPGKDVRLSASGSLQILVDGTWYDMIPTSNPFTDDIVFVPSQDASPNQ